MNIYRLLKTKCSLLWTVTALLILPSLFFAAGAGEETSPPAAPDIEIFLEKGISPFTENNPFLKELYATPFWEDLKLSGLSIGLLTLGYQVEKQLGFHFDSTLIKELLETPAEISLWKAFEKDRDTNFVMVLDLQPRFLNLVKLAELFSRSLKKSTVIKENNLDILKTPWMKQEFFHLVRQNQWIVANDPDSLRFILGKLPKTGPLKSFRDSAFYRDYHRPHPGSFKCRLNLMAWLKNLKDVLDKDDVHLAVNMDLAEKVNYYPFFLVADPGFQAEQLCALNDCSHLIPKEPLLAAAGVYPSRYYLRMFHRLPSFEESRAEKIPDIDKDLVPLFNERFFLYIKKLQAKNSDDFLNGVIGFSLNKYSPAQKQEIIAFVQLVMAPAGQEMQQEKADKKIEIYRFPGAGKPAFCVLDNWLLVGTGIEALKESLAVFNKKIPSIADSKEYMALKKGFSRKGYGHLFFSPSRFFQALGQHMLFLAKSTADFNAADVNQKILPVLNILAKMSSFGIFLDLQKDSLKGEVKFVE